MRASNSGTADTLDPTGSGDLQCSGKGGNGGHCCWINGEVCQFLFTDRGGTPRCQLYSDWGNLYEIGEWVNSPIGEWFALNHPGLECADWPQNIPEAMESPTGKCCWQEVVS
jgi:hypothetical protein